MIRRFMNWALMGFHVLTLLVVLVPYEWFLPVNYMLSLSVSILGLTAWFFAHSIQFHNNLKFSILDLSIFLFLGYCFFQSIFFGVNFYSLLVLEVSFCCFFCSRYIYENCKFVDITLWTLVITYCFQVFWGLGQFLGLFQSFNRMQIVTGSFFNSGPYACYLAITLPIVAYKLNSYTRSNYKVFLYYSLFFVFILGLFLLTLTLSRSALIGAFIGCFLVFTPRSFLIKSLSTEFKRVSYRGILCLLFSGTAGVLLFASKWDSVLGRVLIWKISAKMILQKPLFGYGYGSFSNVYSKFQSEYFALGNGSSTEKFLAGTVDYAFNFIIQFGVEFGAVGLLFFLIILLNIVFSAYRNTAFFAVFVSILSVSLFSYTLSLSPFLIILWTSVAAILCESKHYYFVLPSFSRYLVLAVLLMHLFVTASQFSFCRAYNEWQEHKLYVAGVPPSFEDTLIYNNLYPDLRHHYLFLTDYGNFLYQIGDHNRSNKAFMEALSLRGDPDICNNIGLNFQSMKLFSVAEEWFIRSANMVPNRLYPHYLLAKLYIESGQTIKAINQAEYVVEKAPKIVSSATNEMKNEMNEFLKNLRGLGLDAVR